MFYSFELHELKSLLKEAFKVLGFTPNIMTIYADLDQIIEDKPFNETLFFSFLDKNPTKLQVTNKIYDENGDYFRFSLTINKDYNISLLNWSNCNLDFLIKKEYFNFFLGSSFFICGYCYDINDSFFQTTEDVDYFKFNLPTQPYKTRKNYLGEPVIDVSKHWGRIERVCGLEFLAAPLMWFGLEYFKIISKEELLKFRFSSEINLLNNNIIQIKLFDIYDSPMIPENRNKQKEFWDFFKFEKKLNIYKERVMKEVPIDPSKSIQDYILRMKQKRKK